MHDKKYNLEAMFRVFQNSDLAYILKKDFRNMILKLELTYDEN